jgi:CHAD domain-containing protein
MFKEVLPQQLQELRDDLRWLAQTLGEVRDLDVQLKTFSEMSAGALWEESNAIGELMQVLEASHAEARGRLLEG